MAEDHQEEKDKVGIEPRTFLKVRSRRRRCGVKIGSSFQKTGDMRFISHLDLMRLFQRALRRACLPVTITQGFSPHLKISINRALKLGAESFDEALAVHVSKAVEPALFIESLNKNLPQGVRINKAQVIG